MSSHPPQPSFYFDLASPYAYLASRRVDDLIPEVVWRPILVGALHKQHGRTGWGFTEQRASGMREVERRARRYRLPAVRWPNPYPANSLTAMRAVTHASNLGRGREFARAAFALAFEHGSDLTHFEPLAKAAPQSDIDPADLADAVRSQSIKDQLRAETEQAAGIGVIGVPTFACVGQLYWGDDQLELAASRRESLRT
jgi:2-hydroxychromene-2-carboxylate isomerase